MQIVNGLVQGYLENKVYFENLTSKYETKLDKKPSYIKTFNTEDRGKEKINFANMFTESSKNFGFKGVKFPSKKALNDFLGNNETPKNDLFSEKTVENKQNNKLAKYYAEVENEKQNSQDHDFLYPACWDNCQYCAINGIDDCIKNQAVSDSKCQKCCKDLVALGKLFQVEKSGEKYYKTADTFYKPIKKAEKSKDDLEEISHMDLCKSLVELRNLGGQYIGKTKKRRYRGISDSYN